MDDKTFKNEIVLFSVDKENSIIQEEHREGILPVLMAWVGSFLVNIHDDISLF